MKHLSLISLPSVNGEAKTTSEIEKLHVKVLVHLAKRKLWKHAKNVMNFSYECSFILTNLKKIKLVFQKNVFLSFSVDPSSKKPLFVVLAVNIAQVICCTSGYMLYINLSALAVHTLLQYTHSLVGSEVIPSPLEFYNCVIFWRSWGGGQFSGTLS